MKKTCSGKSRARSEAGWLACAAGRRRGGPSSMARILRPNKRRRCENLDKFSHRLLLFGLNILAIEDGPPRRLPAAHASQPASDLALDLPEQVFFIDIQGTGDNGFGHNVHRFKDRV